eukprot:TRINITY_DN1308_c0_g1_i1.p1 TRINITY_DN1308_c0_g1~~TRINITY_DN1308_c0_g1_i1.p1  ORF type:complete len:722 (-),score=144.75 TRINITY_DN1308_c0_g1_i1:168-2333(-)
MHLLRFPSLGLGGFHLPVTSTPTPLMVELSQYNHYFHTLPCWVSITRMSVFQSFKDKMFSNPLITKATENSENPTPGYLYADISKQTYEGGDAVERMGTELLKRLSHEAPPVKIKVLLLIKYLLEKGHPEFQRFMRQHSDELKPSVNYRGRPDPLRGDAPSRLVREKAQVCLNLVYAYRADATASSSAQTMPSMGSSSMTGMGSNGQGSQGNSSRGFGSGSGGGGGNVGGRAVGNFQDPSNTSSAPNRGTPSHWQNRGPTAIQSNYSAPKKAPTLLDSLSDGVSTLATQLGIGPTPNPKRLAAANGKNLASPTTSRYQSPQGVNSMNYHTHSHSSVDPAVAFNQDEMNSGGWGETGPAVQEEADANSYEVAAVTTLCVTRGKVIAPTRQDLGQFMGKVRSSSNHTAVFSALTSRLHDKNWRARLRALHGIYQVVSNGVGSAVDFFSSEKPFIALYSLRNSVQRTVKDQVGRILPLLHPAPELTAPPPEPEAPVDLFSEMSVTSPASAPPTGLFAGLAPSPASPESGSSLFGDLSVTSEAPPQAQAQSPSLLSSPAPSPAPSPSLMDSGSQTSPQSNSGGSLFDLLTPSSPPTSPSPTTKPSPTPSPTPPTSNTSTAPPVAEGETRPRQSSQKMLEPLFTPEAQRRSDIGHIQQAYSGPAYNGYPPAYQGNTYPGFQQYPYPQGYNGQYPPVDFAAAASAPISDNGFSFVKEESDPFAFVNQ